MSNQGAPEAGLPHWFVVGFSGDGEPDENPQAVKEAIFQKIDLLARQFPRIAGVSSATFGANTLFAEEMLRRDAPLSIILPFPAERFKKDFADEAPETWERSEKIIRAATEFDVVHQYEADLAAISDSSLAPKAQKHVCSERDEQAYWEAAIRTVDRADMLFAVWNQKPGCRGGTADAVEYARDLDKPLIIYNPQTKLFVEERIPTHVEANVAGSLDTSNWRQVVQEHFDYLDQVASKHGPLARNLIKIYLYMHLIASGIGAGAAIFGGLEAWARYLVGGEVLFICAAWAMLLMRGGHYKQWLSGRVCAEICRSFLCTWDVRRHATLIHQPRQPIPVFPRLFRDLHFLRVLDHTPMPQFEQVREAYLKERVEHQLNHFREKARIAERSVRRYQALSTCGTIGAFAAAVLAFMIVYLHVRGWWACQGEDAHLLFHILELMGIVLPLAATLGGLLMVTQEASRRSHRYRLMEDAMERLKPVVKAAPTWDALSRAATQVEEELLQELVEWQAFVQNTEHLH